uniref:MHC class I-like antigen recognition-like domain-containing protein n=1 Tax=Balaenoptera musculus TaxID=9771 RepID=A0A8C0DLG0_BALMU
MCTCFWKAVSSAVPPSPGSHSLHYNLTVLSRDGSVQPSFFAGGHLDGQAFLHCDRETGRVEPRGLWAEELGAETWDTESKDLTETWKDLRKLLAEILSLQEEKGVPQSLARNWAMEMEKFGDTDSFQSKYYWAHQPCSLRLPQREQGLAPGLTGSVLSPPGPPAVNVTRSQDSEGTVNLTCWAFGFFPRNSSGVLPDGNGTYRTWVTIRVPQGEEQRVQRHVEHSGNHSAHSAPSGEPGVILEGVVTLGGSEARIRERRADLWLWGAWVI